MGCGRPTPRPVPVVVVEVEVVVGAAEVVVLTILAAWKWNFHKKNSAGSNTVSGQTGEPPYPPLKHIKNPNLALRLQVFEC